VLKVQTAHDALAGARVVVLQEVRGQAQLGELVGAEGLEKEAAFVLEDFRAQHDHTVEVGRFDVDLHPLQPPCWRRSCAGGAG